MKLRLGISGYRHLRRYRRATQVAVLLFLFLIPLLNRHEISFVIGTFYSISIGQLNIVDPAMIVQAILLTKKISLSLLLAGLLPVLLSFFLGRVFCSWMCPYNFIAEYTDRLRHLWHKRSIHKRNENPRRISYWLVYLGILLLMLIGGVPLISLISMPGIISSEIADWVFSGIFGFEILLVVFILLVELFGPKRLWCKHICPVGMTLALFHGEKNLRVRFDPSKCNCGKTLPCNLACPLFLDPRSPGIYPFCYNCGDCVAVCDYVGGALDFSFEKQDLRPFISEVQESH